MKNQEKCIRVGEFWYPVTTLGSGRRVGVWLQGCKRSCFQCLSPELRPEDGGKLFETEELFNVLEDKITPERCPDGLTISGGEPFDQPEGVLKLVDWFIRTYCNDDILIFTGYTLAQLKERKSPVIDEILEKISVLIDGEYVEELNNGAGLRGSSNQTIYVWKNIEKYEGIETWDRKLQCVFTEDRFWLIGIPPGVSS